MIQKKAGRRWTWNSPNGLAKSEIDYILTNRSEVVNDVTVINQVIIGIDFRMAMSNIKLDIEMERKTSDDQEVTKNRYHTHVTKEDRIPNRFDKQIRNSTRTRRHRQHDRNHHMHDQRDENSLGIQQVT